VKSNKNTLLTSKSTSLLVLVGFFGVSGSNGATSGWVTAKMAAEIHKMVFLGFKLVDF